MHLKVAKWIMRAIVVLVVGVMLTAVIISAGLGRQARMTMKEEKKAKAKSSYTEKEMTITEKFRNINIQVADDMDVKLVESDDDKCHITYFDSPDVIHSVTVQDDALVMTCADNRIFGSDIGFGDDPYVVVSIPEGEYGDISMTSKTGTLVSSVQISCGTFEVTEVNGGAYLSNITAENVNVVTDSGEVTMASVDADSVKVNGSSGDFSIMNVHGDNVIISAGKGLLEGYNIKAAKVGQFMTSSGDINVDACDGHMLWFATESGNVDISFLSEKRFLVNSKSGEVDIPESHMENENKCIVDTTSGDVQIKYVYR
ncbi:MAG TPA: hypothetical protein DGE19_03985 [Coprococcus sp.]|nr:hypothetical protein [Coprococcus sp.]